MRKPILHSLALALVSTLVSTLAAAEALATWQFGPGTIADVPAAVGAEIPADTLITAGNSLTRVTLAKAPQSHLVLAPGSVIRLREASGGLVVELVEGVVQANIEDKGPYADLHVVGAAIDVRVTGTLFIVERVKKDTDYVALVQGTVRVNLRKEVALALNQDNGGVELLSRQGLSGSTEGGLGAVTALNSRPQVPSTFAARATSVQEQALAGTGGWEDDRGMELTAGLALEELSGGVIEAIRQEVSEQVADQVVQDVANEITSTIVQEVVGGVQMPLAGPPAPPF